MPEPSTSPEPSASIVGLLRGPLDRARAGDPEALEEVRRALDEHPEVWRQAGDLAAHVEGVWLDLVARGDAAAKECFSRHLADLKRELAGPSPTIMERLLAERAAACWLQLQLADMASAEALSGAHSKAMGNYLYRRQDSAHRRYMQALGALETVGRLLPSSTQPSDGLRVHDGPPAPPGGAAAERPPAPQPATRITATA